MKKTLLTLALAAMAVAGAATTAHTDLPNPSEEKRETSPTPPKEGLNRMNNKYINIIIVLTI